jgi:hypothetical protein
MIPLDRIVITTFPGYFFTTVLCIRSVQQYFPTLPIDIIIDDVNIDSWPSYVDDVKQYLSTEFLNLNFVQFSQIPEIASNSYNYSKISGWFRQQLIKLHLDQLVDQNTWLVVDADVIFYEPPTLDTIAIHDYPNQDNKINDGNRLYAGYMLAVDDPFVGPDKEHWAVSDVPYRVLTRDLLISLRNHVEQIHHTNFLNLHTLMITTQQLVANGDAMTMSEFHLIEVFRNKCYPTALQTVGKYPRSNFLHTCAKEWTQQRSWFESQNITVPDTIWNSIQCIQENYLLV